MSLSLLTVLAVNAAKLIRASCRLLGRQGTALSGRAALALSPSLLRECAPEIRRGVIAVCGTNGKTTTNNLLCAALEKEGFSVVCNRLGSNMPQGIAAAFTGASSPFGKLDADYACLEVDEAYAVRVFASLQPDYMILTNLFRDQLDRYGEIDHTMELLTEAVRQVPAIKLIINADDPLCVRLAQESGKPFAAFGISGPTGDHPARIREGRFCRVCGSPLTYDYFHFGQLGNYRCAVCGFRRPDPEYQASGIRFLQMENLSFDLSEKDSGLPPAHFETGFHGLYSLYNILAAWSVLREDRKDKPRSGADIHSETCFRDALRHYRPPFGRNEVFRIGKRTVLLNLAKNPAGFDQNIDAMLRDPAPRDLLIVINDNAQDGTDISWLWDVDFDRLADTSLKTIRVSGTRALDMQLRLKYVGIKADVSKTPEEAIRSFLNTGRGSGRGESERPLCILVNYTALMPVHVFLQKQGEMVL